MKFFLQIFLIFLLIGCQSKENKDLVKISGKWLFAGEYNITTFTNDGYEIPPSPPIENLGFNFYSKDSCEANQIFVDLKTFDVDWAKRIGRNTIYKLNEDSLRVFNRTLNKWESAYIMKLDNNNLVLNYHNVIIRKFARVIKD